MAVTALLLLITACGSTTSPGTGAKTLGAATPEQPPIITGFLPPWQSVGSAITISGMNFDTTAANNTVKFNGTQAVVAAATATSLVVIVPVGATIGPITVATTTAVATATSPTSFVVLGGSAAPAISGFSPSSGNVGATVTIDGTSFYPLPENNIVTFNGTQASITAATATSLTVTVPDGVSGNITVTTPGGTAISSNTFAITSPEGSNPVVKSFTPLRGMAGTSVTIDGRNFDAIPGNNIVAFNGTVAVVSPGSTATRLAVTVPAGATGGPITITNPAGITARSSSSFTIPGGGAVNPLLKGGSIQGNNLNLVGMALTVAGGGVVNSVANGNGTDARFNNPNGITSDGTNLYVADSGNRVIRKIEIASKKVTTLAGSGLLGATNGTGLGATFSTPNGITTDGISLFVADSGNNRIRKITPLTGALAAMTSDNAQVTTLAGSGSLGFNDAQGTLATFKGPYGITTDGTSLYVADGSNRIRQIDIASKTVTTLAGSGAYSSIDGVGTSGATAASFYRPHGIAISPDHSTLYVTDSGSNKVRQIDIASKAVTTIAGSGAYGSINGAGLVASFQNPNGITTDGTSLYIADSGNQRIRQIDLSNLQVSTLAGSGSTGSADNAPGTAATSATFRIPNGITMVGSDLYISDSGNNEIRKISGQVVSTFAGSAVFPSNNPVGVGTATKFNFPYGITTDSTNLYVADSGDMVILKIVISTGAVSRLAGSGYFGSIDATGGAASFNYPMGLTTDGTNVYVVDTGNQKIRQIAISNGVVTTLAGSGTYGSKDAVVGTAASFSQPFGITTDNTNLYVTDSGSNKIRKIVIDTGEVSTLAVTDSTGAAASFKRPTGITTDGTNLYVADSGNNTIRQVVIATGVVSTLAGSGLYWNDDLYSNDPTKTSPTGVDANFRNPVGITTDGTNLYVADTDNNEIRKINIASRMVTTLAGSGAFGSTDGTGTEASFSQPVGITTDGTSLYTTEYLNNLIRKIQ